MPKLRLLEDRIHAGRRVSTHISVRRLRDAPDATRRGLLRLLLLLRPGLPAEAGGLIDPFAHDMSNGIRVHCLPYLEVVGDFTQGLRVRWRSWRGDVKRYLADDPY